MNQPNWTPRTVEIDGETYQVEYPLADQMLSVRLLSGAGWSAGLSSYNKGDLSGQLVELTRELVGRA